MKILCAAIALAFSVSAALAAEPPADARHDLNVQIVPDSHRLICTDSVGIPGPDGIRTVKFRVRKEFRLKGSSPAKAVLSPPAADGWASLDVEADFHGGLATVTVEYEAVLDRPVAKSSAMAFVAGDDTDGYVGPEGVFLPGESGWYPETGGMMTASITVMLPSPWRAVSQGRKASEKEVEIEGARFTVSAWAQDLPADGLSVCAGVYELASMEHEGVALSAYLFKKHAGMAKELLESTAKYLEFYSDLLGPFPYAKFDIVENFFASGFGMPSYTLLGSQVFDVIGMIGLRPGFIDHELVHNWWGNSVYVDYSEGNWCEGATTYCANYYGGREAQDPAEAAPYRELASRKYSISVGPGNDYPLRDFKSKKEDFDNEIGYGKSSMFFHIVRRTVGDDAFWSAMKAVAADFKGRRAAWSDFRKAFQKASGRDLSALFEQWLSWKGAPVLKFEGGPQGDGLRLRGAVTAFNSLDSSKGYDLSVPLEIALADGSRHGVDASVSAGRGQVDVALPAKAVSVEVDPGYHVFRKIPAAGILPCLNAALAQEGALAAAGSADKEQADALAWALESIQKHGKGSRAQESDLPGNGGFVLLGMPADPSRLARAVSGAEPRFAPAGSLAFGSRGGLPFFSVNGLVHADPDSALLVSFALPGPRFCTVLWCNSAQAAKKVRNLFHYGWDQFVVFESGRAAKKGVLKAADPAADSQEGVFVRGVVDFLVRSAPVRKCTAGADSAEKAAFRRKLGELLSESAGGAAKFDEFDFVVPRAGQSAVVRFGGPFGVMEIPLALFFPCPPMVEFGGHRLPAAGAEFEFIVHSDRIPDSLPGPTLLILKLDGQFRNAGELIAALEGSHDSLKAVVLYESPGATPAARRGFGLDDLSESVPDQDPQMRISGFLSRLPKPYAGPICMVAKGVEGRFELSGRVSGKVFFVREESRIRGANISAAVGGRGEPSGSAKEILLTAHYDCLGEGFEGADDNASGVATVLAAARALRKANPAAPVRVVLFDAEEWGLHGSRDWLAKRSGRTGIVFNVDTVGSRDADQVYAVGMSRFPEAAAISFRFLHESGLKPGRDIDRFAYAFGSDHYTFSEAGIPAVTLFSSSREIMNSRKDTSDRLDCGKIARLAAALAKSVEMLAGK